MLDIRYVVSVSLFVTLPRPDMLAIACNTGDGADCWPRIPHVFTQRIGW